VKDKGKHLGALGRHLEPLANLVIQSPQTQKNRLAAGLFVTN
jgi:hypothetical protein